jgi:hypothetical protein
MFAAPLQSALIRMPSAVLYCPRVMRRPDGLQLAGFSPYVGKKSLHEFLIVFRADIDPVFVAFVPTKNNVTDPMRICLL